MDFAGSRRVCRSHRALFAVLLAFSVGHAVAQPYPSKPIRLINPWVPGGSAEVLARAVTLKMSEALGQPIVIESKSGANGTIGTALVAKAAPDGYTILLSNLGPTAISPSIQKDLPYDSVKDFVAITQLTSSPILLMVRNDIPIHNMQELIAYAKANPGKLTYGSAGIGSITHLGGEMLKMRADIDLVHVPYKGTPPMLVDMLGGRLALGFNGISGVIKQVQAGQFRALAITTLERSPTFPEIPTMSETLPGFEFNSWYGLMAPAGTPRPIVTRLRDEAVKALRAPDVAEWLVQNGLTASGSSPDEYAAYIKSELEKWAKIAKVANATAN